MTKNVQPASSDLMDEGPLKPGYTRIYEMFHGYRDYSPEEMEAHNNDPLVKILNEELTKAINEEIITEIVKNVRC